MAMLAMSLLLSSRSPGDELCEDVGDAVSAEAVPDDPRPPGPGAVEPAGAVCGLGVIGTSEGKDEDPVAAGVLGVAGLGSGALTAKPRHVSVSTMPRWKTR